MCPVDEQDRAPLLGPVVEQSCGAEAQESAPLQGQNTCPAVKPWRHGFLPVSVDEYLKLLDWTGRQVAAGKRGVIDEACPPILERLGLQPSLWLETIEQFETCFHGAVGHVEAMVAQGRPHRAALDPGTELLPRRIHVSDSVWVITRT